MQFEEQQPIYIQIADEFCKNIILDKWQPNERIPSVRDVAVALEVNPNTVARTFEFMQSKDIIFNKRGIGYFVSEDGKEKALEYRREEFMSKIAPNFFDTMYLLGIPYSDLEKRYNEKVSK
ncbi:MAG: GntR family transcriptional regulator [Salinivirgaceae bacterium]|jgi:GntR family transcriptional regulator|nr:GntR family transcriptional regulator [Bacteroidales bacterium]HOG19059.1 GntR family transcriptional regulator [Salinivirgaceae bacterium]